MSFGVDTVATSPIPTAIYGKLLGTHTGTSAQMEHSNYLNKFFYT